MTIHFRFLLADPHGDIELLAEDLKQPFRISPAEEHPSLTLRDYFTALQEFLTMDNGNHLRAALEKLGPQEAVNPSDISEILIRSEKHGPFYHIASIVPATRESNVAKFAATTALSEDACTCLQEEYEILQELAGIIPDHLPELCCMDGVSRQTEAGPEQFLIVIGEWLEGYHEWHVSNGPADRKQEIQLWDYENGYRFLTDAESHELLRQAAYILTCCYDQASFRQIYPWHHGAGDFVVRTGPGALAVKLITARQYEPLVDFDGEEESDRIVAAIHFLLNLALRIRLDRMDGTGEPAWLDDFAVHAAVEGFFAGLAATEEADRLIIGPIAEFLEIMRSFEAQEILEMYHSLLELYVEEDEDDFSLIKAEIPGHAEDMHKALQRFSLGMMSG